MSWRTVCITKRCKLSYSSGYMIIREMDTLRIHLSEISVLILESTAISMTANLLNELSKAKINVIFCDEKHNPFGELVPYYGSHDCSRGIRDQIRWEDDTKDIVWKYIVADKIKKQSDLLERRGLLEESELLRSYINEIEPGDPSNREGHAAKVYFNALFGKAFSRDNKDLEENKALDYAYSLLLSIFNREVAAQGRLTQVGIWHDNIFNYFNFSSDLMEAFRPLADERVLRLSLEDGFGRDEKHELLSIFEADVMLNGVNYNLNNAVRLYVLRMVKVLDTSDFYQIPVITYV